jgi:hypothetical protein
MKGSLNARLCSKDKLLLLVGVISLLTWQFGAVGRALASTNVTQDSLTFEIKLQNNQNLEVLQANAVENLQDAEDAKLQEQQTEIINQKVSLVRNYLESKGSPLANYTEILIAQPNWKTIIAVSNAESTLGKHCYVNNCSGIFGPNGLKTYETVPDWIVDMQSLLSSRYDGWTLQQMDGTYVYPRSNSWYIATTSVYKDLNQIEQQFQS